MSESAEQETRLPDLDPVVQDFIIGLTKDRIKYLEASIQHARERETTGRFLKWLGLLVTFVTGMIVAFEKLGSVMFKMSGKG